MLGKSPIKWRQRPDMTIAVDWDVKHQFKQTKTLCPHSVRVMYNLGTILEGPRDQGPGPSRTKGYNLGTR